MLTTLICVEDGVRNYSNHFFESLRFFYAPAAVIVLQSTNRALAFCPRYAFLLSRSQLLPLEVPPCSLHRSDHHYFCFQFETSLHSLLRSPSNHHFHSSNKVSSCGVVLRCTVARLETGQAREILTEIEIGKLEVRYRSRWKYDSQSLFPQARLSD